MFNSVEQLQALLSLSGSEQSDDEEGDHHDEEGAEVNEIEEETLVRRLARIIVDRRIVGMMKSMKDALSGLHLGGGSTLLR